MINRKESRKAFNIAVVKNGSLYDIVRYTKGFDKEPITLLPNVDKNEIEAKLERAIHLIASTSQEFGVIIIPQDRNDIVRLVLMFEDSGINSSDIVAQKNGFIRFNHRSDSAETARTDIESFLAENKYPFDEETISIMDKITDTVTPAISPTSLKLSPQIENKPKPKPTTASLSESDLATLQAFKDYPELLNNPQLKAMYNTLIQKTGAKQEQLPPSIIATDEDNTVIQDSVNLMENQEKGKTPDEYISELQKTFSSASDLIKDANNNGISTEDFIKYAKANPEKIVKFIQ